MNTSSADTLSVASTFLTTRPGPTPRMCTNANSAIAAIATQRVPRERQRHVRKRHDEKRRGVGCTRNKALENEYQKDRACGHRAGKAGDERRPPGHEPRKRPVMPRADRRTRRPRADAAPRARRTPSHPRTRERRRRATSTETRRAWGTTAATCGGVKRMPPPMTLATMMAAASNGPSRLSSDAGVGEGTKRY